MAPPTRSERSPGSTAWRSRTPGTTRGSSRQSLAVLVLVLWTATLCGALGLHRRATQQGFGWIDPQRLSLGDMGPGCDPRWSGLFDATTHAFPLLRSDDREGLEALARAIEGLSFVRSVGQPRVVWPDALELELVLHVPVACVPIGERFQTVAEDGTLLPGLWPAPPEIRGLPLPVLGPLSDGEQLFPFARAGDWLAEPEHLAALDVALSLQEHLDEDGRAALGAVLIDASQVLEASVDEPGIRLELACGRTIWFGRAPTCGEPGELPVALKWSGIERAVALLVEGRPENDWDRLDVRWDHPELRLVHEPLLARAEPEPPRAALGAPAGFGAPPAARAAVLDAPAASPGRPRVR